MLTSEINDEYYLITWDNPDPANSSTMIRALKRLGSLRKVNAKTTCKLFPRKGITFGRIRYVVRKNLHIQRRRAVVQEAKSRRVSHIDNALQSGLWRRG